MLKKKTKISEATLTAIANFNALTSSAKALKTTICKTGKYNNFFSFREIKTKYKNSNFSLFALKQMHA